MAERVGKGDAFMIMTDREIYLSWKTAKNKGRQIGILAELNGTDKNRIRMILREQRDLEFERDRAYNILVTKHRQTNTTKYDYHTSHNPIWI